MKTISLNGNFIVCSKVDSETEKKMKGLDIYSEEKMNWYKIDSINSKEPMDFPFAVGDTVCSASTGTVIDLDGTKTWLFRPEHILAKIVSK